MSIWYEGHLVILQAIFTSMLLAFSVQVPIRVGVFSFAGIGSYAIGGYTAAILFTKYGWSEPAAIAAAMVLAGIVGYLLALVVQRLDGLYLGMATIAFDLILGVIATNWHSVTGGATGLYDVLGNIPMPVLVGLTVIVIVLLAFTERGRLGRRITVVNRDPHLASSVGVRVSSYREAAFVISGLLGALAGALNTLITTTIGPGDIGFTLIVTVLTIIIVGGARSWLGPAIGAVIFTWLPDLLQFVSQWQAVIYGFIVAVAAVWMPGGLVGLTTNLYRRFGRRSAVPAKAAGSADIYEVTPVDKIEALVLGNEESTA
jgi:branched-chain amino acid transport system permease protein